MIFEIWCLLTGGHAWESHFMAPAKYCERCGALKFRDDREVWIETLATVLCAIRPDLSLKEALVILGGKS